MLVQTYRYTHNIYILIVNAKVKLIKYKQTNEIKNPYMINGNSFQLRFYVLLTSCNPLSIYIYEEGIAFFKIKKSDEDLPNDSKNQN